MSENETKETWELVAVEDMGKDFNIYTERMKVDGGHLYRLFHVDMKDNTSLAMHFVPNVDLTRYQAHLRDAYNQGFKDGQESKGISTFIPIDCI